MAGRLTACVLGLLLLGGAPGCATWEATRLYERGTEALDQEQTDAAIADLERAAELWPESGEIQNHLGIAYLQAGRRRDARDAFARAVALNCSNPAARHNLALLEAEELGP
jgi:Flp pilus assembly protein TadD